MPIITGGTLTEPANYEALRLPRTQEVRVQYRIDESTPQIWKLAQRHFVVGGQHLVLDEPPQIAVYSSSFQFEVVGWGIRLKYGQQGQIARELIRKFLSLHAKAENDMLDEQEEARWSEIAKRVDYRRFTRERSPFQFVQGTLADRKTDTDCRIEWHTGEKERVTGKLALAFSLFDPGEQFNGFARLGEANQLVEVRDLSPAPRLAEDGERMWREWPANR
jgi:hypothetical protein